MYCKKCLTGRTGDKVGDPCRTPGCDGVIEDINYRDLVDVLPEPMTCGRRGETLDPKAVNQDRWEKFKSNGDRVCSCCGSLHPEDFFRFVKECADAPINSRYNSVVEIEVSTKNYKVYVHRPSVRNAHEGGIKFYMQHVPRKADGSLDITDEQHESYHKALIATSSRFDAYMKELHRN